MCTVDSNTDSERVLLHTSPYSVGSYVMKKGLVFFFW